MPNIFRSYALSQFIAVGIGLFVLSQSNLCWAVRAPSLEERQIEGIILEKRIAPNKEKTTVKEIREIKSFSLGHVGTEQAITDQINNYLQNHREIVGVPLDELNLGYIQKVEGKPELGLKPMWYGYFKQVLEGVDVEGCGLTVTIKEFDNEKKIVGVSGQTCPEVKQKIDATTLNKLQTGSARDIEEGRNKVRAMLGKKWENVKIKDGEAKIVFVKDAWRAVREFHMTN